MLNAVDESAKAIANLISNINIILEYYVPGFCLVFIYRRFRSNSSSGLSEAIQFGLCVVLSYILHMLWIAGCISLVIAAVGILYFTINKIGSVRKYAKKRDLTYSLLFGTVSSIVTYISFIKSQNNEYFRVVYEIALAIILAFDLVLLHKNRYAKTAFSWVNNTALSETVFECSKMEMPCNVIVFGEGRRIEGRLLIYDLPADDAWLLLDKYKIIDDNGKILGSWKYDVEYHQLLVPLSEVKCIKVDAKKGTPENYDDKRKEEDDASHVYLGYNTSTSEK